jgi:hypothetical protein
MRSRLAKFSTESSPRVTVNVIGGEETGVYIVCPNIRLAVPASPELEEYW